MANLLIPLMETWAVEAILAAPILRTISNLTCGIIIDPTGLSASANGILEGGQSRQFHFLYLPEMLRSD
jgi:hypothetical protein